MEKNQFKNLADLLKAIEMKLTSIDKKQKNAYNNTCGYRNEIVLLSEQV